MHAGARGRVGVRAVQRERALIDPVQPPGVAVRIHLLGPGHVDFPIGLDVGDARILPQGRHLGIGEARRKTLERPRVRVQPLAALRIHERLGDADRVGDWVLEYDDVLPSDDGILERSGLQWGHGIPARPRDD